MDRQQPGRMVIVGDSWYCALAAVTLMVFAGPMADALGVAAIVMVLAAIATAVWAVALRLVARRSGLRPWLVGILVANVVAAGLLAALAVNRPLGAFSLLLLAVAVEVGAFAGVQAVALRRSH